MMKKLIHPAIAIAFLFILLSACKKETTADSRDSYVGYFTVTDSAFYNSGGGNAGIQHYTLQIKKDSSASDGLILVGLNNSTINVKASLANTGFGIPSQLFDVGYNVTGNGTVTGTKISITYANYDHNNRVTGSKL